MFVNLLGLAGGGRNNLNKDALVSIGPITMFTEDETVVDYTNHLHPQIAVVMITQADQVGEGTQPAQPPLARRGKASTWGTCHRAPPPKALS
jgi:hypothetical protein